MSAVMEQSYAEMMNVRTDYLRRRISPKESYDALLRFPRYFEIETVNACNARCPMCTIDDWDRKSGLMSDELFAKICKEISHHPEVLRVHLYRDGEPLLDKKLADRILMMKKAGVRKVGISTNVSLLDFLRAQDILIAGIDEVILSIDSLQRDVYERIRAGLNYDEVMQNALDFIELRDKMRPQSKIWVRMIRQESNKDEWPEYHEFWSKRLKPHDRIDYRDIHNWGAQLKGFKPITNVNSAMPCVALWSLMVIFADGSVPMCNVDYNNKHPVGNLNTARIEDLWTSMTQNDRRQIHLADRSKMPMCAKCTVWDEEV